MKTSLILMLGSIELLLWSLDELLYQFLKQLNFVVCFLFWICTFIQLLIAHPIWGYLQDDTLHLLLMKINLSRVKKNTTVYGNSVS